MKCNVVGGRVGGGIDMQTIQRIVEYFLEVCLLLKILPEITDSLVRSCPYQTVPDSPAAHIHGWDCLAGISKSFNGVRTIEF